MRILHLITGLELGGAEMMLYKLLATLDRTDFDPLVVTLIEPGPMREPIQALGVPVVTLGMRRGLPAPRAMGRLVAVARDFRPDLIQSWMYHADLVAVLTRPLMWPRAGRLPRLVWNIRQSNLDPRSTQRTTRLVARLNALLSHLGPDHILCCSEQALRLHQRLGYRRRRTSVIPNGFDLERFRPDPAAGLALRDSVMVAPDRALIGMVARFDPQKDPRTFLQAAARVRAARPDCRFLLCGPGMDSDNAPLVRWIDQYGLGDALILLGARQDTPRIYAALDLLVSSSAYGEGFPNVIGEAMACAVPCVVTDVGDSARIVADTGITVPPRQPEDLAAAQIRLLDAGGAERVRRGQAARARIAACYDLDGIARRYADLYLSLTSGPPRPRAH
ncbi:hypothetical protein CKO25_09655 [Thiocapsa imhoffii]|uniref:Glycosyltransferase subfamily 4-like N-terminal domain-containing protein n=1 Tax=Thiocapsa imhoffii TaxID=382777 RepID=A0A9X0WI07_9GAMM|nr:glycosyltransferase [Thiocapsa imhoffii]MBK1644910.1 hypothetical protein [Thiocapsa imhoffii]